MTLPKRTQAFDIVKAVGLEMPGVEAATRYDGSPVLKLRGCFLAGLATHRSAESDTLVVRIGVEEREALLEDAPGTYYLTDYDRNYPIVLVRLAHVDRDALRDLLSVSWRLTALKGRPGAWQGVDGVVRLEKRFRRRSPCATSGDGLTRRHPRRASACAVVTG